MPDLRLIPRPAIAEHQLHELAAQSAATITPVTDYALATVMARLNQAEELTRRVREAFGLELAWVPRRTGADATAFAWSGPGHWLAMTQGTDGATFMTRLRATLDGVASVSDQSDGRVVIRISGPRAREILARGVPIDLHPRAFVPGDTAVTLAAHIVVHIWQLDAVPTYELAVSRSMVASFLEWLGSAAAIKNKTGRPSTGGRVSDTPGLFRRLGRADDPEVLGFPAVQRRPIALGSEATLEQLPDRRSTTGHALLEAEIVHDRQLLRGKHDLKTLFARSCHLTLLNRFFES